MRRTNPTVFKKYGFWKDLWFRKKGSVYFRGRRKEKNMVRACKTLLENVNSS